MFVFMLKNLMFVFIRKKSVKGSLLVRKRNISIGLSEAMQNLRRELKIFFMHRQGMKEYKNSDYKNSKLKLNIGCGKNKRQGWVNIDLKEDADLKLDMREGMPFRDNSCEYVYSEHFLEHIDYPGQALAFLRECYRVLDAGGIFSVGVPDAEWPILEYCGLKNEGYFRTAEEQWNPEWCHTKMEHINYLFRCDDLHRFAYDFETLNALLASVGFEHIQRRSFDTELDSREREVGTLYVDAVKPGGQSTASSR